MKTRIYASPELIDLGSISDITAVYGVPATYDTFINQNGIVVDEGQQSLDICVSNNSVPDCVVE